MVNLQCRGIRLKKCNLKIVMGELERVDPCHVETALPSSALVIKDAPWKMQTGFDRHDPTSQ